MPTIWPERLYRESEQQLGRAETDSLFAPLERMRQETLAWMSRPREPVVTEPPEPLVAPPQPTPTPVPEPPSVDELMAAEIPPANPLGAMRAPAPELGAVPQPAPTPAPEPSDPFSDLGIPTLASLVGEPESTPAPAPAPTPAPAPPLVPGEAEGDTPFSSSTRGPAATGASPVGPDEPVNEATVTRAAAAALTAAGLPAAMAPYVAGIAINEGILVPGTIARDNWAVGGVKAPGSRGVVTVPTREVINGQSVMQTASFGAFGSMQEGLNALATFIRDSPRFGPIVRAAAAAGDFAGMIEGFRQAGYATDPSWTQKVTSIASRLPAPMTQRAAEGRTASGERQAATAFDAQSITRAYEDVPYVFGGAGGRSDPRLGVPTDCSGFVAAVWKTQYGLDLPAHTDASYNQLRQLGAPEVTPRDARAGDVVYYMGAGSGGAITHHMGIYAGDGKVLDMSTGGGSGVRLRDVGHAGRYVILRDPRVNPQAPRTAEAPPPIVETGIAERTPTAERTPRPREVDAVIAAAAPVSLKASPVLPTGEAAPPSGPVGAPPTGPMSNSGAGAAPPEPAAALLRQPLAQQPELPAADQPFDPDQGPREALPGSVGAAPYLGPLSAQPEPVTPAVLPPASPYAPGQAESMEPRADRFEAGPSYGAVTSTAGEPDYAPPRRPTVTADVAATLGAAGQRAVGAVAESSQPSHRAAATLPSMRGMEIVQSAIDAFGDEVGRRVGRSLGLSDQTLFEAFGIPVSAEDVAGVAGSVVLDPTNLIGAGPAARTGRAAASAAAPVVREGAEAVGRRAARVGVLPAVNRALSEAIVGGTGGAVIEQGRNPDEDPRTAAARGFAAGAVGFPLATRAARGAARLAGATADEAGAAFATLGPVPEGPRAGLGRVTQAFGADPRSAYDMGYRVVDLDDLIPSNTPGGAPNPAYPRELQPRSRERAASRLQIDQIARDLEPNALLTDAGRLDSGPPIVGPDLIVESGNGRVLALGRAADQHPERYGAYVDALQERLPEYGLGPDDLAGIRRPVLVRERLTDVDRPAFAAEANNPGLLEMADPEVARADAARLTDDMVARLNVGEHDTIATALRRADNIDVIRAFVATLPANQQSALMTSAGTLSRPGIARLESALLMRTYGGEAGGKIAEVFIESADPILRNVENALMASLPDVAKAEALIRSGARSAELSIADDVAASVEMLARLRTNGLSVADYVRQGSLFARETTPLQDSLIEFMAANMRSAKPLREALKDYAARVENAADPNQVGMFGDTLTVGKEDLLRAALARTGRETGAPLAPSPGAPATPPVAEAGGGERVPDIRVAGFADAPIAAGPEPPRGAPEPVAPAPAPGADDVARLRAENADLRRVVGSAQRHFTQGAAAVPTRRPQAGPLPRQERAAQLSRPITLTDEEQIARIRLDKFPEEVRAELLAAARGDGFGEKLRRGVLSDDAVRTLAAEYAPTVDAAIAGSRRGRAYAAEEIVGLRNLLVGQAERVAVLGREIADAKAQGISDVVLLAQHGIEGDKLRRLSDVVFGGAPAEAGRALRQFRMLAQSLEDDPARAGERYIRQRFGSPERAEEVAAQYQAMVDQGADPIALAAFLRSASGDWMNRLGIIRYASMLSSTTTHMVNATGNLLLAGVDVATKPLAVGIDVLRSGATGQPRAVFASEIGAQLHGMGAGAVTGLGDAAFILRHGFRPEDVTKLDYLRAGFGTDIPGVAPAGSRAANVADFIIEGPLRALAASDAVFRSIARGGHLAAEATAEAMRRNGGKPASAVDVAELMTDHAVMNRAETLAARSVLQERRGVTDWIVNRAQLGAVERLAVEAILPFVRTPYNIVAQGVGMTPAGAVKALYDAGRGTAPPRELADRLARASLGTAVMGAAAWQYASGALTGAYPEDERERSTLPPGWRPWSARVTAPNGEVRYISLASLGPLAIPAAVVTVIGEAAKRGAAWDLGAVALGLGQFASDQTFLRGVGDMAKALSEGGTKLENVTENVASSYTPHFLGGGALGRQVQQVLGMPARDPHGAAEAVLAQFPYTAGLVPVRRDVLGREAAMGTGGIEAAVAPYRAGVEADEPVIAAYRSAGEGLPMRAPTRVRDPGSSRVVELTREQQDAWRVAFGAELARGWRSAGRPRGSKELRAVEQNARDAALSQALRR